MLEQDLVLVNSLKVVLWVCPTDLNVQVIDDSKITCVLPPGNGNADVVLTSGQLSDTLQNGYRYILGTEA